MAESKKISVYVVEDNDGTRSVIREILTINPDIELAGQAANGEVAVQEVLVLKPDVLLVDLELPGLDGIQVLKLVKANLPETKAVMLSAYDKSSSMFDAFAAGAQAYFSKNEFNPEKLVKTIVDVQSGAMRMDPAAVRKMIEDVANQDPSKIAGLSEEQKRLLLLVAERSEYRSESQVDIERAASNKIESDVPSGDWSSFLKRLQKFKE